MIDRIRRLGVFAVLPVLATFGACQRPTSTPSKPATAPVTVDKTTNESELNRIRLTEAAARRLAIETRPVEAKTLRQVRPYGAELLVPTGATIVVSCPVTGTLSAHPDRSFPRVGERLTMGQPLMELLPLLSPERAVLTPAERIRLAESKNLLAQSRVDAQGQVDQAAVQVEAAELALTRAEKLRMEQAGTARAVDEARAQLALTQKTLEAAQTRKQLVDGI